MARGRIDLTCRTTPGGRAENQDVGLCRRLEPTGNPWGFRVVMAVADGMGGHQAGDVASRIAMDTVERILCDSGEATEDIPAEVLHASPETALAWAIEQANSRVHSLNAEGQERSKMGTTLTLLTFGDDRAFCAHVGDSRAYRLTDGGIEQLTRDHSYVTEQIAAGRMTHEEARRSPFRSQLTRTIGTKPETEPDVFAVPLQGDEVFLVCSDGLSSYVSSEETWSAIRGTADLAEGAQLLLDLATAHGTTDNCTVSLAEIGKLPRQLELRPATELPPEERPTQPTPVIGQPPAEAQPRAWDDLRIRVIAALVVVLIAGWLALAWHRATRQQAKEPLSNQEAPLAGPRADSGEPGPRRGVPDSGARGGDAASGAEEGEGPAQPSEALHDALTVRADLKDGKLTVRCDPPQRIEILNPHGEVRASRAPVRELHSDEVQSLGEASASTVAFVAHRAGDNLRIGPAPDATGTPAIQKSVSAQSPRCFTLEFEVPQQSQGAAVVRLLDVDVAGLRDRSRAGSPLNGGREQTQAERDDPR